MSLLISRSIFNDDQIKKHLLIIQCDSGHDSGDLIACARYRIYDLWSKADKNLINHVLFIIHLPQQAASLSFVGFQGDPWISYHIDDLRQPSNTLPSTREAIYSTISELFLCRPSNKVCVENSLSDSGDDEFFDAQESWEAKEGTSEDRRKEITGFMISRTSEITESGSDTDFEDCQAYFDSPVNDTIKESVLSGQGVALSQDASPKAKFCSLNSPLIKSQLFKCLPSCIHAAASRLKDFNTSRSIRRVEILVSLIPEELPSIPGEFL